MSYELDEIVPVSKGGDPFDRSNVAPAHRICNQRRGAKPLAANAADQPGGNQGAPVDGIGLPLSQEW